ncbi:hypothetical protein ATZ33_08310 [Enterococcus silesiacus]|uniref:WxL domain-containing protein n=1 Tax=Enterococcus silesiacus TaxID=332949 RepID=A0A0S3KAU6_9ENTE|nr:WxL domain-containing protein [Enterococcus silesiacus]ALS01368.1 hypothetical protein ATZ33_08310 [Enterococcus silesiacus]OJG88584.1 hypothetical protein RV15_GL001769 [Enterococcus silesiacus]
MKNLMKYSGVSAVLLASLLAAVPLANAEEKSVKTDGKATFTTPTDFEDVIKPGTNDPIDIEGPQTQIGGVQLLHVPNFDFGSNPLKPQGGEFDVKHETYKEKGQATEYAIPLFIEVGDFSGKVGTEWNVKVEQDTVFKDSAVGGTHTLDKARIQVFNQKLHNNLNDANVANMITGINIPASSYAKVPVNVADSDGPLEVMKSKAAATVTDSTNGTISSVVLKENYNEADYGSAAAGAPAVGSKYSDVKLNVPAIDKAQTLNYATKLTWTLTVEP